MALNDIIWLVCWGLGAIISFNLGHATYKMFDNPETPKTLSNKFLAGWYFFFNYFAVQALFNFTDRLWFLLNN